MSPLTVTPHELVELRAAAIVDVRPSEERDGALGFIPGSRSWPQETLVASPQLLRREYLTQELIVFTCLSGKRSAEVAAQAGGWGFTRVANLAGGLLAWRGEGLPTVGTQPVPPEDRLTLRHVSELPRAIASCFVAESVEAQLSAGGSDELVDPMAVVSEIMDQAPPKELEDYYQLLDRLAETARRMGHPLEHIAANLDRMRDAVRRLPGTRFPI